MASSDVLPPSPPSTSSRRKPLFPQASMNLTSTPDSPASFPGSSNAGTRKRVEFSPWTNAHEPISSSQPPSSAAKALPPSSECQPTLKSILKPVAVDDTALNAAASSEGAESSVGDMIESIVQQLAQDDRSISLDAYQTLASVIREYDEIPEEAILKSKMTTILKYIKRDLLRQPKLGEAPIADANLITQALKVLVIFVWNREYASLLSDEYRMFILDRSIQVLTEHSAPKSVIIHYLHLLATQDFRPALLSNSRISRLLEALKALTEHVKGNGAVSERLLVYQKLLDQAKPAMKTKANLWVEELLTSMTNGLKDIRVKATALGLKSCSAFPTSSSISATVRAVLRKELEQEKTFSFTMCRRLEKMVASKEEAVQVPQIWTIVILLSNGLESRIDNWPELKDWLRVIQRCLNSSESVVRQQSHMAWNRFVYVVRPHEASETLMAMLAKPLSAQFERHVTEQTIKGSRASAVSAYCNLLYYAFRPAATHKQYTRVWNEYIVKVMKSSFFENKAANSDVACRIFMALLWNSNKGMKVWNENRALENTPVEPEELPTIDCKWIRARSMAILDMFRVLVRYSSWGASGQSDRANIAVAWAYFLKALREASSKEIKPSVETIQAMVNVANFLGLLREDLVNFVLDEEDLAEVVMDERVEQHHTPNHAQLRQLTVTAISELGHDLLLAGLQSADEGRNKTFVLCEMLDSFAVELGQVDQHDHIHSPSKAPRSALQISLSQYEKCIELLCSAVIQDSGVEGTNPKQPLEATTGPKQLGTILENMPKERLVQTLTPIRTPLATLVRDIAPLLAAQTQSGVHHPCSELIGIMRDTLAQIPPSLVSQLDEMFAAFLESSHGPMMTDAVEMWNKQFGQLASTQMGPRTSEAVRSLQNQGVQIETPLTPKRDHQLPGPKNVVPTVSDDVAPPASSRQSSMSPDVVEHLGVPSPILGSQYSRVATTEECDVPPASPERSISRPRSRHDDSQLHFVAIESALPLPEQEPESQLLTMHQKEVRDRQRSEPAVVFPDLRSSPRPQSKSQSLADCEFARKAAALEARPSTPTLPANHDQGEAEIMASPTPRARHTANQITDIEVPSSPPSMLENHDKAETVSSPLQGMAEDSHIGIDLAIAHSEAPLVPFAMEVVAQITRIDSPPQGPEVARGNANDIDELGGPDAPEEEVVEQAQSHPRSVLEYMALVMDVRAGTEAAAPPAKAHTDSDDIDLLSASQLSQDLDRHISEAEQQADLEGYVHVAAADQDQELRQYVRRSTNPRKRKSNSQRFTRNKRRQSQSASQSSSISLQTDSQAYATPGELLDCIEVAPSHAVQAIVRYDLSDADQIPTVEAEVGIPKRRRRRSRRTTSESPAQQHGPSRIEVVVPTIDYEASYTKEEEIVEAQRVNSGIREHHETIFEPQEQDLDLPQDLVVATADESEEVMVMETDVHEAPDSSRPEERGAPPTIIASLQGVLDRLRSGQPNEDFDLRMVDDLCFQIRFQAQVLTQQRAC